MARQVGRILAQWQAQPGGSMGWALPALPAGVSVMDGTGTPADSLPPSPNVCVLEVWAGEATLDALPAATVLWRRPEDPADPSVAGRGEDDVPTSVLKNALKNELLALGVTAGQLATLAELVNAGATWRQIAARLALWLQGRPKG